MVTSEVDVKTSAITRSTALKSSSKFFPKPSFVDQNQQPVNNVEPFDESILRASVKSIFPKD
jgi:hypothetical protein